MTEAQFNLQKIEAVLVPFRKNSVENRVPTALAEAILLLGQTVEPSVDAAADSVATDNDNLRFYEFFADALFLTSADSFERTGIENAFAGLEEVLVSAVELVNSPLEFKNKLLAALEKFKVTLEEYDETALSEKDTVAVAVSTVDNLTAKKIKAPQKQINIILYYLWNMRKTFFPPRDLAEIFDQTDESERQSAFENNFKALRNFFVQRKSLKYSDPAVAEIFERFIDFKNTRNQEESESLTAPSELFRQAFQNLGERWRKTCVAGYRATRIAVETPAPDAGRFAERSDKTAWVIASILKFAPAETVERNDVLMNFDAGLTGDALRLCLRSRFYYSKTTNELFRIAPYVVLRNEKYPWGFRRRSQIKRQPQKEERKRVENLLDPRDFENIAVDFKPKIKTPGAVDVSGGAWSDEAKQEIAEGAAPGEFDFTDEIITEENAPPGSAAEAKAFRVIGEEEVPSWGRSRLTDEMLGVVWAYLKTQAETKPDESGWLAALAFTELLILFGFPPHSLLTAATAEGLANEQSEADELSSDGAKEKNSPTNDESLPVIIYENDCLRVRPVRSGGKSAFGEPVGVAQKEYYVPSSREFVIPVPLAVNDSLKKLTNGAAVAGEMSGNESKLVFSYFDEHLGKQTNLTEKVLNRIYKSLGEPIGERITAVKIANSARTLLREDGVLTNLEIALLSGEITHRVLSPMFYTNFQTAKFLEKYCRSARRVLSNLTSESRPFIEHYEQLKIEALDESKLQNYSIDSSRISKNARVGSPFVPVREKFAGYLSDLYASAKQTSDFVLRHNRMTAFAALALMALTGLRPMELSFITRKHLNLSSAAPSVLPVIAKINQRHTEWRALETAPETVEILRMYESFSTETRRSSSLLTEYTRTEIDARLGDALFFYLRRSLAPVKMTRRGLLELVKDYSYLELSPYPWRLNSPRHFYRTTAATELEVPERVINSLLGHQTVGVESLGLYSAYDRSEETSFARRISRFIWNELNFDYVR